MLRRPVLRPGAEPQPVEPLLPEVEDELLEDELLEYEELLEEPELPLIVPAEKIRF